MMSSCPRLFMMRLLALACSDHENAQDGRRHPPCPCLLHAFLSLPRGDSRRCLASGCVLYTVANGKNTAQCRWCRFLCGSGLRLGLGLGLRGGGVEVPLDITHLCATAERFCARAQLPARHGPHCASFGTHGGAESAGATAATRPARLQFGACHTELWLQPSPDYGSKRTANCTGAALRNRSTDAERSAGAAG